MKFYVVFDVDATVVDTESMQASFYREAFVDLFRHNDEAINNLEQTLSSDAELCRRWYFENLMGKVSRQKEIIGRWIGDVTEEQLIAVRAYVDAKVIEKVDSGSALPGMKELIYELSRNNNIELCFISGGSMVAVTRELVGSGVLNSEVGFRGLYTREHYDTKKNMLKKIMQQDNVEAKNIIIVGDGYGDMEAGRNIDVNGASAFCIGYMGAFVSQTDEFKSQRAEKLYESGADIVVSNALELRREIMSRISDVSSSSARECKAFKGNKTGSVENYLIMHTLVNMKTREI